MSSNDQSKKNLKNKINWNGNKGGKEMVHAYLNNSKRLLTDDGETLEYIRITREVIDDLLATEPEELVLFFAVRDNDLNKPDDKQCFTLVLASAKTTDGQLSIVTDPVYDKFDPCPDECLPYANAADDPH